MNWEIIGGIIVKKLTKKDLYHILYGCTILGTGGGGNLENGLRLIDRAIEKEKEFVLVDLEELKDEELIGTPYYCGAVSPETEEERKKYEGLEIIEEEPTVYALEALEEFLGEKFTAVVSTELGGGNTAAAFYTGAMLGKYIVDADPAGRSVPELQHSTYYLNDIPISPIGVANRFGEVAVIKEVVDDFRAEALVRSLAVVSQNTVGVLDHPCRAKEFRNSVIPRAISYAWKIGKALCEAKENGEDVVEKVIESGDGIILFKGNVKEYTWKTENGFTIGDVIIEGSTDYKDHEYKIWFKNENIVAWKDGEFDATVPDLICMIDNDTKEPVTNPNFKNGMSVSIFALPSPGEWITVKGLEAFGPKSFGFDIEYRPITERK